MLYLSGMRKLPATVQRTFDIWIQASTWHTNHPADEARFHAFVWSAVKYMRGRPLNESDIRAHIAAIHGSNEHVDERAMHFSLMFRTLYDFGKAQHAPGTPDFDMAELTSAQKPHSLK